VSHGIGEEPWRSSSLPTLFITFEKCWKTTVGDQTSTVRRKQTNTEYGEENLQTKRACLCTQVSGSHLMEEIWYGQNMF